MSNEDWCRGAREPNLRRQTAKTFELRAATSLARPGALRFPEVVLRNVAPLVNSDHGPRRRAATGIA